MEVWPNWDKPTSRFAEAQKRIIEGTARCPTHSQEAVEEGEAEDRRKKAELYRGAIKASHLPSELVGLGWDDIDPSEPDDVVVDERLIATQEQASESRGTALAAVQRWAKGEFCGIVLAGSVGLGKTRMAAVATQDLIYQRIRKLGEGELHTSVAPIRWVSVPELILMSRAERGTDRYRDAERVMAGAGGLVLDDIDKVKPTEFALDLIFEAIDRRTNRGRPLMATTNLPYPELEDLLGKPIASRLAGYCEGFRIYGADRRRI